MRKGISLISIEMTQYNISIHNISQYHNDPNYFQKQHCHYQLLAKAMTDAMECLLCGRHNLVSHQNDNLHQQIPSAFTTHVCAKHLILLSVVELFRHLQHLHVYINHVHQKCMQKTVARGWVKMSSYRDNTVQHFYNTATQFISCESQHSTQSILMHIEGYPP
jgi:hypothetical protein